MYCTIVLSQQKIEESGVEGSSRTSLLHLKRFRRLCHHQRVDLCNNSTIMLRRSLVTMNKAGRTIVRDPRKKAVPMVRADDDLPAEPQQQQQQHPLPMQPQQPGLGSYMTMGAGMAMGVTLVSALFGGF